LEADPDCSVFHVEQAGFARQGSRRELPLWGTAVGIEKLVFGRWFWVVLSLTAHKNHKKSRKNDENSSDFWGCFVDVKRVMVKNRH
jgi:hypothetical protein